MNWQQPKASTGCCVGNRRRRPCLLNCRFFCGIGGLNIQDRMEQLTFHPLRYRDRWFAYLDLLGFSALVTSKAIEHVIPVYAEALKQMHQACRVGKNEAGLLHSWFSDTFITYSGSGSLQDFARVESASRIFFQLLLLMKRIPVRGCISYGKLYSQARRNIFIGPALIEAHKFGEALDWVGFCLAPRVEKQLKADRGADPPADDAPVEDIDDEGHVDEPLPGPDVGASRPPTAGSVARP